MANIEVIKRAFREWGYYQKNPSEVDLEIEDWVEAIVEGLKRGYDVVILDEEHVGEFEEGRSLEFPEGEENTLIISEEGAKLSDSQLREHALRALEGAADLLSDAGTELVWIDTDKVEAMLAFEEMGWYD